MMRVIRILALAGLAAFSHGCDNTFNPNGPYKEQMVVYAVLTTEKDTQFVRVYSTYPVSGNPVAAGNEARVTDAEVFLISDTTVHAFHDTTLERSDTSRFSSRINAHVRYGMRLNGGRQYELRVVSPSLGTARARATALYSGGLAVSPTGSDITVYLFPAEEATAVIVRMYYEYDVLVDTGWQTRRTEVPMTMNEFTGAYVYPHPLQANTESVLFEASGFASFRTQLRQRFSAGTFRLRRSMFVLTQMDDALYAYYNTANGFPDSGTLRLDEPDYSNIEGALGVFAMTSQTVVYADTAGNQ